ncbi:MAG TPA: hypothetical protein VF556_07690 [Pyrinomonadaceae bacterium]
MTIYKLSEILADLEQKGFLPDDKSRDSTDCTNIERNRCPKCKQGLIYKGFSKFSTPVEYQGFGVCEPCDYAELFYREKTDFHEAKPRRKRKMRKFTEIVISK